MWRNGRRNGLKIRWPERAVRVRVPPSAKEAMSTAELGGERLPDSVWEPFFVPLEVRGLRIRADTTILTVESGDFFQTVSI
jgi:hypothetical protein